MGLLWVEAGRERLAVACALCGYPALPEKADVPLCVSRLCTRLSRAQSDDDLPLPPPAAERIAWAGQAVTAVLTDSLDILKAALRGQVASDAPLFRSEADVCLDALRLAKPLQFPGVAEPCVRLLRFLPPDLQNVEAGETLPSSGIRASIPALPLARQAALLRDAASQALGAIAADSLTVLWDALNSPQTEVRQSLLPTLDYLNDLRAIPYLIQLLERRAQWPDGEMVGWFVVRACERIGDRRALPALRRLAAGSSRPSLPFFPWRRAEPQTGSSPELIREAARVVQALERGRPDRRDRDALLRPSKVQNTELLLPATDHPDDDSARQQLLRPDEKQI